MESIMAGRNVYITIDWQEQNVIDDTNRRQVWQKERVVCGSHDHPEVLPCSNPTCKEAGGFEIGERIRNLLTSGKDSEQNSLICRNAIHADRDMRCMHTIVYSIACIRPYQRERSLEAANPA
jgi:hypothetical protein